VKKFTQRQIRAYVQAVRDSRGESEE
jgi:hypothetical protein